MKRVELVMSDSLQATLEELRSKTCRESYAEVLRDALRAYLWLVQEYEKGNEVLAGIQTPLVPPTAGGSSSSP